MVKHLSAYWYRGPEGGRVASSKTVVLFPALSTPYPLGMPCFSALLLSQEQGESQEKEVGEVKSISLPPPAFICFCLCVCCCSKVGMNIRNLQVHPWLSVRDGGAVGVTRDLQSPLGELSPSAPLHLLQNEPCFLSTSSQNPLGLPWEVYSARDNRASA